MVGHQGATRGYLSEVLLLPEHGVGAVVLLNADLGRELLGPFRRYLLELLFDGQPKAHDEVVEAAAATRQWLAELRAQLTVPAAPQAVSALAAHYESDRLGTLDVEIEAGVVRFDFGEWKSEVASRAHADGSASFETITPGYDLFSFVAGKAADGRRQLVLRDAQHEYAFVEKR